MTHSTDIATGMYLKKYSLEETDNDNTQPVTSCLWGRPVDSDSVEVTVGQGVD